MTHTFLTDIVLLLAASIPIVVLLRRVKLPVVAGFVVAGALVGPHALSWIHSVEEVESLAEIGVALLLFTVGLEFSLPRLLLLKRALLVGGVGQVLITLGVVTLGGIALGREASSATLFAFLVVLSSTAVVLKTLTDERQVETPHGQLSVAILLFQDLAIIPLLLFVPLLGGGEGGGLGEFGLAALKALGAVGVVLFVARYGFSRMAPVIVRAGGRELFTLFTVLVALGAAWLTESLDLPLALGAFIAGLVVSESEYNHQVVDEILPFRDVFSALFFVSIGMLFDASIIREEPVQILGLFAAVAGVKAAVVFGVGLLLTRSRRTAAIVAASLFQVGEFAFVVASQARELGVLGGEDEQRFLAVAVLSMVVTPLVMRLAWHRGDAGATSEAAAGETVAEGKAPSVLIAGSGLTGEHLARVLLATGIDHLVMDTDPHRVKSERAAGMPIVMADASRADALLQAGIVGAKVFVVAINDAGAARRAVALARKHSPSVQVIVRTRFLRDTEELLRLGANQVVPEEFETSVEIFGRVLRELRVPRGTIAVQTELVRREGYQLLRGPVAEERQLAVVGEILASTAVDTLYVSADRPGCGRSLGEMNFRARTGATVLSVIRGSDEIQGPGADLLLQPGDLLVVRGEHRQLELARDLIGGTLDVEDSER